MATAKKTPLKSVAKTKAAVAAKPAAKATPTKVAAKPAVKPVAKAAAKPAAKVAAKPTKVAKPVKTEKAEKPRKPKLVRDSFTIPKTEYVVLQALKERAERLTRPAKKSEILRAGVAALAAMSDLAYLQALAKVPAIKTGRPGKD
ncbi:hypothetical protein ACO2Q9_08750 [Variovorax sp. VNK109]|uniref:hypothetical protein n=1 Tax=Variovorax sp. VNK109 TaxID=3400919 RepID=UPI003C00E26E